MERRLFDDEGLPVQRKARATIPNGDVQRAEPSGVGTAQRRMGQPKPDARGKLRPHTVDQSVTADPVRAEVSFLTRTTGPLEDSASIAPLRRGVGDFPSPGTP